MFVYNQAPLQHRLRSYDIWSTGIEDKMLVSTQGKFPKLKKPKNLILNYNSLRCSAAHKIKKLPYRRKFKDNLSRDHD